MERHFVISINYEGKQIDATVQRLSDDYPLIYAVWPQDESLKKSFDNSYVVFTQNTRKNDEATPTTWHKVHYSKEVKRPDLEFELTVWEELLKLENTQNS